jgi:hypothetical protein
MKQLLWSPMAVAGACAAFAAVAGLVWLSRGRSARLIQAKLHLGGLLLALGVGSAGCDHLGTATCYAATSPNTVVLASDHVHLKSDPTVRGTMFDVQGDRFSFAMHKGGSSSAEVARGALVADDGAFDQSKEPFHLSVPADLQPGTYTLVFYQVLADTQRVLSDREVQVLSD